MKSSTQNRKLKCEFQALTERIIKGLDSMIEHDVPMTEEGRKKCLDLLDLLDEHFQSAQTTRERGTDQEQ